MTDPALIAGAERLCVDFDGTLTEGNVRYWAGERADPDDAVCQAVRGHYHAGGSVIVWTARPWSEANTIAARLTEWGVPYHGIRCEKGSGDIYVDDKALTPEDVRE